MTKQQQELGNVLFYKNNQPKTLWQQNIAKKKNIAFEEISIVK